MKLRLFSLVKLKDGEETGQRDKCLQKMCLAQGWLGSIREVYFSSQGMLLLQ